MTGGYRSSHFRYDCATSGCFQQAGESWDDIITAFPRGIRPTDIDGMVEVNGSFLFLEEKGTPDATLTNGQRYAFHALAQYDGITVVVFRPTAEAGVVEVMVFGGAPGAPGWDRMPRTEFVDRIRSWAARADASVRASA